jgi:hypothetical protein
MSTDVFEQVGIVLDEPVAYADGDRRLAMALFVGFSSTI